MKRYLLPLGLLLLILVVNTNCTQTNTKTDNDIAVDNQVVYPLDSLYGSWVATRYVDFEGKYVDLDTCDFEARVGIGESDDADKGFFKIGVSNGCNFGNITYHITQDGKIDQRIPGVWTQKYCPPEETHWYPTFADKRLVLQQADGETYMYAIATARFGLIHENDTVITLKKVSKPD